MKIEEKKVIQNLDNIVNNQERDKSIESLFQLFNNIQKQCYNEDIQKIITENMNLLNFMKLGKDDMESEFINDIKESFLKLGQKKEIDIDSTTELEKDMKKEKISTKKEDESSENEEEMEAVDESFLDSFVTEASDLIEQSEPCIETLVDSQDPEDVNTVFRLFHTLKGLAGFSNLDNVTRLTHNAEQLLTEIRNNPAFKTTEDVDLIFDVVDLLKRMVANIKKEGSDKGFDSEIDTHVLKIAERLQGEKTDKQKENFENLKLIAENSEKLTATLRKVIELNEISGESHRKIKEIISRILNNITKITVPYLKQYYEIMLELINHCYSYNITDIKDIFNQLVEDENSTRTLLLEGFNKKNVLTKFRNIYLDFLNNLIILLKKHPTKSKLKDIVEVIERKINQLKIRKSQAGIKKKNIRVSTEKLDKLFNLVGELITTKNMVVNHPNIKTINSEKLTKSVNRLEKIVRELQETTLSIRTIPLTNTFNKMKRLVRDVSKKTKKKVDFEVEGEATEVDKNIVEKLADPLIHIIRNAIDHGIENPEERRKYNKNEVGNVSLKAMYDSNEILIIISDDGKGFDRKSIIKKAQENQIIDNDPDELTDKEVWKLVFEPGFSTVKEITNVSGRGVGMDVVKKNIENKLRGKVEVESEKGKGTIIKLRIPLTLAIMDSLILKVGDFLYAVSLEDIDLSFQPKANELTKDVSGREIVNFRDNLLPIIRLHEKFSIEPHNKKIHEGILMKVKSGKEDACLFFDELIGQRQLVVRPLPKMFDDKKDFLGSVVLENGNVGMILDVGNVINSTIGE